MLQFNSKGLLVPNSNIKSTAQEFEEVFVTGLSSSRRKALYLNYLNYSNALKELLSKSELLQWIDGSFVTMKPEPDDIDLVTFIDNTQLEAIGSRIDPFKYPSSMELFGVDAYIVRVYNEDEKNYPLYLGDQKYWMDAFDKTRRTRYGQRLQKGFLEINH